MNGLNKNRVVLISTIIFALLISLPYLLAWMLTPEGKIFSGFLVNPLDGFSYLAKMKQGQTGEWLFQLSYTTDPGEPSLLFIFYIFLGHVVRWLRLPQLLVFHGVRIFAAAAMAWASYIFFQTVTQDRDSASWSYAIFLLGSGLGWLVAPFGLLTSDLIIPESIPLFSASLNPHFPLSFACLALASANVLRSNPGHSRWLVNLALGLILGAVQPFAAISLIAVLGVWITWELSRSPGGLKQWRMHSSLSPIFGLILGALPWLIYEFYLTGNHPILLAWNLQNQTPSPQPVAYILGFGIPLALAVRGVWGNENEWSSSKRMLFVWLVVNSLLLYAPFNLQRRFSLGLFLPIAAMAGIGIQEIVGRFDRRRRIPYVLLAVSLPSNLFALAAGVAIVVSGSPLLLLERVEHNGYRWIAENLIDDPLVLAAPVSGNRLPAYAEVKVLYGHPFETPQAELKKELVEGLIREDFETQETLEILRAQGVEFVLFGPNERELIGRDPKIPPWRRVLSLDGLELLAVPEP